MTVGLFDAIPMADYVADRIVGCEWPTLSSSVAHRLLTRSPLHAYAMHPRLGGAVGERSERFDLGTAAHALLLEGNVDLIRIVDADDWRGKAARAARDGARADGKVPLLAHQAEAVTAMCGPATLKLSQCPDLRGVIRRREELVAERTIVWTERGTWCRCRPDWMTPDGALIVSYKTCQVAEPDAFARVISAYGYDVQMAFERAAVKAALGVEPAYVFLAQELDAPHACSLIGPSPALLDLGARKMAAAVQAWAECLEASRWPAYPERVAYVDPPAWALYRWGDHELSTALVSEIDDGRPLDEQLFGGAA